MENIYKARDIIVEDFLLLLMIISRIGAAINVTGFTEVDGKSVDIFTRELNWFEAQSQCRADGYLRMDYTVPASRKIDSIAQAFRDYGYPPNMTFWTGIFRPYQDRDKWFYAYRSICKQMTSKKINGDVPCDHQCLTLTFVDNESLQTIGTANCQQKLPYLCAKDKEHREFLVYSNYTFTKIPAPATSKVWTNISIGECQEACGSFCVGFTYSHTVQNCTIIKVQKGQGYAYLEYNIEPGNDVVTHGVRNGSHVQIYTNTSISPFNETYNVFPICDVTVAPPGYCPCQTDKMNNTELEAIVQELVQNLTINKDATSKTTRKYSSAFETRPGAVVSGVLGIIMITSFCVIVVALDFQQLVQQLAIFWVKLKRTFKRTI